MAQLHVGLLSKAINERAIHRALDSLPKKIGEMYNIIMQRIENQDDEDVELAKNVLGWITYAKRPLTTKELQHALATSSNSTDVEECDLTDESILMSVCMGIVTVDPESNIIRLVHYTTQEYIERIRETQFPEAQTNIAKTCITYLAFPLFGKPCVNRESMKERTQRYKLSRYAAQFWALHTKGQAENEPDVQRAVVSLLASENKRDSMLQLETYANSSWNIFFTKGQTLLHVIAKNGLATICELVLSRRINGNDTYVPEVDI